MHAVCMTSPYELPNEDSTIRITSGLSTSLKHSRILKSEKNKSDNIIILISHTITNASSLRPFDTRKYTEFVKIIIRVVGIFFCMFWPINCVSAQ